MACILKLPTQNCKGVISFTSVEYDYQIKKINHTKELIRQLKDNWIICYHSNWINKNFEATNIFDAIISNKELFAFKLDNKNKKNPIINTGSLRMSPFFFKMQKQKTWDFFHVSRYEPRKNIGGFFNVVKSALKLKEDLNGVLLISVEPKKLKEIRNFYNSYFTEKERNNFELITLDYDLPFPISKKTLAHFYNSAKVTLNTHVNEPHGRVVGYSLAAGLPVVGFSDLTQMVPEDLRKEPFFFVSDNEDELANLLIKAIDYVDLAYEPELHIKISNMHSEVGQSVFLKNELISRFNLDDHDWFLNNLDLRLASHFLYEKSSNGHCQSILNLLYYLLYKKKDLSSLCLMDNNFNIESNITNQINKVKIYKPLYIKLLDYLNSRRTFINQAIGKILIGIKAVLPNFIVKILKKKFITKKILKILIGR